MDIAKIKIPEIMCNCGQKMKVVEQDHKTETRVQISYACECGYTGMVLLTEEPTYRQFIKDREGEVVNYEEKEVELK